MAIDVSDAFIKQYEADAHLNFQRYGSKLNTTIRRRDNVEGESVTFQVVGKGTATQKGRHTNVPPMSLSHTPVECTLQDWYAADYADVLDLEKLNIDERMVIAKSGAAALGRKTDELITDVLNGVSSLSTGVTWSLDIANDMLEALSDNDVTWSDGDIFAPVSQRQWNILNADSAFSSADFVRDTPLVDPMFNRQAKLWSGVIWFPCPGDLLPLAAGDRSVFMYHRDAIGLATGHEISAKIDYIPEKVSWFINHCMSMNAVVIDATGVVKVTVTE